jgi:hypothetical protein
MPIQTLDQQDGALDALDGLPGASLRSQAIDAAALVMLGQPPTGGCRRVGDGDHALLDRMH